TTARTGRAAPRTESVPPSSQLVVAATQARYACSLEPPRNAQRQSPSTATETRRTRPLSVPITTGLLAPRRRSWAVSAVQAPAGGSTGVIRVAGGNESTGSPRNAPASGEVSSAEMY